MGQEVYEPLFKGCNRSTTSNKENASVTLGIGLAGIGFMGTTHFHAISKLTDAKVVAIATRDESKWSGDWRRIKGNFGDGGGFQDLSDVSKYRTLEEMLSDPRVDLVDICLPTNLHRDAVIAALRAGKDVLVEKPIALNLRDAQEMVAVAEETGKRLMVAQVLRFMAPYRLMKQVIESGQYGDVVGLSMKRVIGKDVWDERAWLEEERRSGGPILDLLIHDVDFVNYVFGRPDRVVASGHVTPAGHIPYYTAQLVYKQRNMSVVISGGTTGMPSRPFEQGYDLYLRDGYLQFNSAFRNPPGLITRTEPEVHPEMETDDPFESQLRYAVDTVTGKVSGDALDARTVLGSLEICLAVKEAILTGEAQDLAG